jgi:hypothetical protein
MRLPNRDGSRAERPGRPCAAKPTSHDSGSLLETKAVLDAVLIAIVLILTAITLVYAAGCGAMLSTDPTREGEA